QCLGQQDPGAAVGALHAGDVAPIREGAGGNRWIACFVSGLDGEVVEVPRGIGLVKCTCGPAGEQAAFAGHDDQSSTQVVLRIATCSVQKCASLSQVSR